MNEEILHWSERLAEKIISEKKEPYVISAGATTSGPAHLGTVCEFLYPWAIKKEIERKGKKARFVFVFDILDAFDSIPKALEKYEEFLRPHLGKPLVHVPDPFECHSSYGEHFASEVLELMNAMEVKPEIWYAQTFYEEGHFHKYTLLYMKNLDKVKEIVERTSGRQLPKDWSPIMPICENCGKISTTRVLSFKILEGDVEYEYSCGKDVEYVKGCGYRGKGRISEGKYKLQWRLHWPAWQQFFKTSSEGGGVDHFTRGSSWDTAREIHKEIFHTEPPIPYKYGFILVSGRKMSKSKGNFLPVNELIRLIPPEVLAYHLLKYDLQENIDFQLTPTNILGIIQDYESASKLKDKAELTRAEKKKLLAYSLVKELQWKRPFRDILLLYLTYRDWKKVEVLTDKESVSYLKPYIERIVELKFYPEEYDFTYSPRKAEGIVREFFEALPDDLDALGIHNFVYEFANSKGIPPENLFKALYQTLIGKDRGPRLGRFLYILGVKNVKRDVL